VDPNGTQRDRLLPFLRRRPDRSRAATQLYRRPTSGRRSPGSRSFRCQWLGRCRRCVCRGGWVVGTGNCAAAYRYPPDAVAGRVLQLQHDPPGPSSDGVQGRVSVGGVQRHGFSALVLPAWWSPPFFVWKRADQGRLPGAQPERLWLTDIK